MEPGHVGRVESRFYVMDGSEYMAPQWSPATWAGWSSKHKRTLAVTALAAMEPGHVGRVETGPIGLAVLAIVRPQWSPATWAGWR